MRLLVLEDEPALRETLVQQFRAAGLRLTRPPTASRASSPGSNFRSTSR